MLLFLPLFLAACSSVPLPDPTQQSIPPFQGAGIEQFFLPELPNWANGSVGGHCHRDTSVRYLDYAALERIHGLDFTSRVELQTQYNRKWQAKLNGKDVMGVSPQEEAAMFNETLEQIRGGLRELRFPAEGPIHLVWWESLQPGKNFKTWLKKLADRGEAIVLVGLCTSTSALDAWLEEQDMNELGIFSFGTETMGPMLADGTIMAGTSMPLEAFFPLLRTTFWKGDVPLPDEFNGNYTQKIPEE